MITEQTDAASPAVIARLAACLDVPDSGVLPPLWHWALFLDAVPARALGADGHRAQGGLVAADPALPARMWAGGEVRWQGVIPAGAALTRESRVVEERVREGRSGRLRFVTLQHEIFAGRARVIEERQDIVYRAPGPARGQAERVPPPPAEAVGRVLVPDEVLLFRFSALTFNAHRIHYDAPYARDVENYPGLVVHGPLQAMLLAQHLLAVRPGAVLTRFSYRGQAPAFVNQPLHLLAWPDGGRASVWQLQTRDASGAVCLRADADLAGGRDSV